jgi:hypothetical protein
MSAAMNRREFFNALFARGPAGPVPGGGGLLPPEFTPAAIRAEAARLGLDAQRMTETEMAEAVLRAMSAQAPAEQDVRDCEGLADGSDCAPVASTAARP